MLEKASIYKLSCSKAPKAQQICRYRHEKNLTGVGFSFRNNFVDLGSFAQVTVPVGCIIP